MEKEFLFQNGEELIAQQAADRIIQSMHNARVKKGPIVPFPNPPIFDVNLCYNNPTLNLIIKTIRAVVVDAIERQYLDYQVRTFRIPPDVLSRIAWAVFGALKLAPLVHYDEEGKVIEQYTFLKDVPDNGSPEMDFLLSKSRFQYSNTYNPGEIYDRLILALQSLKQRRYKLLEKFFEAPDRHRQLGFMQSLQNCFREILVMTQDIQNLSKRCGFSSPFSSFFVPPKKDQNTGFDDAVHWNEKKEEEELLQSFSLSPIEESLMIFLPEGIKKYEGDLFQFAFTYDQDDADDTSVSSEEIFLMNKKQCERKMVIAFYAFCYLSLHKHPKVKKQRMNQTLQEKISYVEKYFFQLQREIEDLRTSLLKNEDAQNAAYNNSLSEDISDVQGLTTSFGNIARNLEDMDTELLRIFQSIQSIFQEFLTAAVRISTDEDLTNLEKKQIVQSMRDDLLQELLLMQKEIGNLEYDDSVVDQAQMLLEQSIQQLKS